MKIGKGGIAEIYTNEQLMEVTIKENGERLVNLAEYANFIIDVEETSKRLQKLGPGVCYVRLTPAVMLARAQEIIGKKGMRFKIVDGYRPMSAQKEVYAQVLEETRKKHKDWSQEELEKETDRWVANPKVVPPHTTGGALDLTIVDKKGKELDMGTPLNSVDERSYTQSDKISEKGRANRKNMIDVMTSVGFVNNPREWWHWSYGDRRWAKTMGTEAVYGSK